jgi:predicted transposase YdaD
MKIEGAPEAGLPPGARRLLLAVMTVLAARVIEDRAFLDQCIHEVEAMGDNYVIDELERRGRAKGRAEGLAEGRVEGRVEGQTGEARRAILRVIERRFGEAPQDLRRAIEGISALPRLEILLDEAVTCASLAGFRKVLEER